MSFGNMEKYYIHTMGIFSAQAGFSVMIVIK